MNFKINFNSIFISNVKLFENNSGTTFTFTTFTFTKEEYNKAKRSITEGKACGKDNISPEILKMCNLDEEILEFFNMALLEG